MPNRRNRTPDPPAARGVRQLAVGERVVRILKVAIAARRPVLIEGATGIGKSELVEQVAAGENLPCIVFDLSVLEPADLIGIPQVVDGRTLYATPSKLPHDGAGVIVLEELNRAERHMQQPALQLLTLGEIHEYKLPEGWVVMACINPENGDYLVNPLDPALRNRFLHLPVRADRASWLEWARKQDVHPAILATAAHEDQALMDVSPRSWTQASIALRTAEAGGADRELAHDVLAGYMPEPWAELVLQHTALAEEENALTTEALLQQFHERPELQRTVAQLRESGRTDRLEAPYRALHAVLAGADLDEAIADGRVVLESLETLFPALPGDLREGLQEAFGENPHAEALLPVRAAGIVKRYARSKDRSLIREWAERPDRDHRVRALVTALAEHVRRRPEDDAVLRRRTGLIANLRNLMSDVGPERAEPLDRALHLRSIDIDQLF